MAKILKDDRGLYVNVIGGRRARPVGKTKFKAGDTTPVRHLRGSTTVGLKGDVSAFGRYQEYWQLESYFENEEKIRRLRLRKNRHLEYWQIELESDWWRK